MSKTSVTSEFYIIGGKWAGVKVILFASDCNALFYIYLN